MKARKHSIKYRTVGGILRIFVCWNSQEVGRSTGLRISQEGWDGRRCRPGSTHGPTHTPADIINSLIADREQLIANLFIRATLDNRIPSRAEVAAAMAGTDATSNSETFADTYNRYILTESARRAWTHNTIRSIRQLGNLVTTCTPGLRMAWIDSRWLDDFTTYQQSHRLHRGKTAKVDESGGYTNQVILKNCRILRSFLRWAAAEGLFNADTLRQWQPRLKTTARPVIFLTRDELERFAATECAEGSPMERARDLFAFASYTGLRYSDIMALQKTDVHADHITLTTRKTATRLTIELNSHSRRLLDRYASQPGPHAMPRMDAAQLNIYIKKVAKLAGIDEPVSLTRYYGARRRTVTEPKHRLLSSHAGRRTFVCLALSLGISPTVVMKWTGHSDYAAMKPYIDVADATRRTAMNLFDD